MCIFAKNIDFISGSVYDNENVPSGGGKMKSKDVISAALKEIGISQAQVSRLEKSALSNMKKHI